MVTDGAHTMSTVPERFVAFGVALFLLLLGSMVATLLYSPRPTATPYDMTVDAAIARAATDRGPM